MTPFARTLLVEVQRGFARRLVRVLGLLFLGGFLLAAVLNFRADSDGPGAYQDYPVIVDGNPDPTPWALDLVELWPENGLEPILALAAVPLMMAGVVIGASLVGAEWRSGTMTTNLTWEPRRARLATAKFLAAGVVAFLFSLVLQGAFVLLLLANIATHGSFDGADSGWATAFAGGLARGALVAALAAVGAAVLAMIGRNTTVAIATGFVVVSILEPILRVWKPWTDRWLLTTNASRIYLGHDGVLDDGTILTSTRATVVGLLYVLALAAVAIALFVRRDVAATT